MEPLHQNKRQKQSFNMSSIYIDWELSNVGANITVFRI